MYRSDVIRRISRSTTIALLLSPVGLLLISVVRLLIVSNNNPVTALAITSSQGYINTLLGTIIPVVQIFMPYLALLLLFTNRVIPGVLTLLATALISPISIHESDAVSAIRKDWHVIAGGGIARHVLLIAVALPFTCLFVAELAGISFTVFIRTLGTVASLALLPIIVQLYPLPTNNVYANLVRQPWLPAETITLTSHQDIIGYVLSSDGYWLEVLVADNRIVQHYRMSDIADREICQIDEAAQARPLITLAPAQAAIPSCPQPISSTKALPGWLHPILNMQSHEGTKGSTCTMPIPEVCQQTSRKLSK